MSMADDFNKKYGINQPQQSKGPEGLLPTAGGITGGVLGGAAGALIPGADLSGVPEVAGAAGGAAIGQGLGETLQELLTGQKLNPVNIASQGAQGGLLGAIPGAEELKGVPMVGKLLGNVIGRTAIRGAAGAAGGAGAQVIQNAASGNPLGQDVGATSSLTGGANALMPALGSLIKSSGVLPNADRIFKNIATKYVGEAASRLPEVTANLDYSDPLKSQTKLENAAEDLYNTNIKPLLANSTAKLGDFINKVEEGANMSSLPTDVIQRNMAGLKQFILRNSGIDLVKDVPNLQKAGSINDLQVPLDALNQAKIFLGKQYKNLPSAYSNAREFLEEAVGKDHPLGKLNSQYHNMTDAAKFIEDRFSQAQEPVSIGKGLHWMDMMKYGVGGAGLSALLGNPLTSVSTYSTKNPGLVPLIGSMITKSLEMNPTVAAPLAYMEQNAVDPALQQLGIRLPQLFTNSQQNQPGQLPPNPSPGPQPNYQGGT